ncbi:hypothetical protein AB1Y20_014522 [Prymnesium parvum]|uniref:Gamma-glutamylcyclotransferase n=1 Tax=Prymnesium parvum TaxID=97485 RepID=A0AB34IDI8_PRYPA
MAVVTVIGLGSLLSERSARATFPTLRNFRLGRVHGYRRCFAHPAGIFFTRGIADLETKQIASLSAEPCEGASFVCTVFEVEDEGMDRFREREEEFELVHAPVHSLSEGNPSSDAQLTGLLCCRSTDDAYIARWGEERFEQLYRRVGVPTIWGYAPDSGLRPCAVYLRHCVLAAQKMGDLCLDSFLDDTYLIDRTTTLREYLAANPHVMATLPPPDLQERYGG